MKSLDKLNKWAFGNWVRLYCIPEKTLKQNIQYHCFNVLFCVTITLLFAIEEVKELWKSGK